MMDQEKILKLFKKGASPNPPNPIKLRKTIKVVIITI